MAPYSSGILCLRAAPNKITHYVMSPLRIPSGGGPRQSLGPVYFNSQSGQIT